MRISRKRQKSFIVVGEDAKRMSQKPVSIHGDYDDFRVVLFKRSCLRLRQKYFSKDGKYA